MLTCSPCFFRYQASLEVVTVLLDAHPQAAEVQGDGDWLPLHIAVGADRNKQSSAEVVSESARAHKLGFI